MDAPSLAGASAVILSLSGPRLTPEEETLFRALNPLGFILFHRNCETPEQTRALTDNLRAVLGRDCPILIDQEGGRVQRLAPPHWPAYPPCKTFGDTATARGLGAAQQDLQTRTGAIAQDLKDAGITVNCDPCLDLFFENAHEVIGDRAFSSDPHIVAELGLTACRSYLAAGITPIIKHIPGHGRAGVDSHDEAPVITAPLASLQETDFVPFKTVAESDIGTRVWAMPSPVFYGAIDKQNVACTSPKIITSIIRDMIGFEGIIISDALDMGGFNAYGTAADRVLKVLEAGCDLALHCTGDLAEMEMIATIAPKLSPDTLMRLRKSMPS